MHSFNSVDNPLASGSIQVWDDLITAVGPASLLVLIERRLGAALRAHCTAEDVLQEALLHAWRDRLQCQWKGVRAFRGWLISIVEHRIHDLADRAEAVKRGGQARRYTLDHSAGAAGSDSAAGSGRSPRELAVVMQSTTPSRIAVYKEQAAAMESALASLPEDLIDVVRLRLFDQRSINQIATQLGIGSGAVRHRFRRGIEQYYRRLRGALLNRSTAIEPEIAPSGDRESSSSD